MLLLTEPLEIVKCLCFSYNEVDSTCQLANLDFLENPDVDQKEKTIFINVDAADLMKMYCRGGEHCCTNNSCDEGEGDCNDNIDRSGYICHYGKQFTIQIYAASGSYKTK